MEVSKCTYMRVTRFLLRSQVMWDQVQASTRFASQFFNSPLGSCRPLLRAESASTSWFAATGVSRRVDAKVARTIATRGKRDSAAVGAIGARQGKC